MALTLAMRSQSAYSQHRCYVHHYRCHSQLLCTVRSLPNMKLSQCTEIYTTFRATYETTLNNNERRKKHKYMVIGYEHAFLCYYLFYALFIRKLLLLFD